MTSLLLLERVHTVGEMLLDCICEQMALSPYGCPERRGWVPGSEPEAVNCCDPGGQLTINVVNEFPSRQFPVANIVQVGNCSDPHSVLTYQVTMLRCAPTGNMEQAPTVEQLDTTAHREVVDRAAMRAGVLCCLQDRGRSEPVVGAGYLWMFGDHQSYGPAGGCTGSKLQVLVGLPTCWECP